VLTASMNELYVATTSVSRPPGVPVTVPVLSVAERSGPLVGEPVCSA
jgi:hypothetical protein